MANELEIRNKLKQYRSLFSSTAVSKGADEGYADYLVALSLLCDKSDSLYIKDNNDHYPVISAEDLGDIIKGYNDVLKKGEALLEKPATNSGERYRGEIVSYIGDILRQDMKLLAKVNAEDKKTLPQLLSDARTKTIDLSGQELKKVSASSSVRMPFAYKDSDGQEVSGYFTEKSLLKTKDELIKEDMEIIRSKYPEEADIIFYFQDKYQALGICFSIGDPGSPIDEQQRDTIKRMILNEKLWKGKITSEEIPAKCAELMKDDKLLIHIREYGKMVDGKTNDCCIRSTILESKTGAVTDARNSGMSIVANLLGVGDVIAHSEPMKIKLNGKEIEGTFMRTAQGKDINNIAEDDHLTKITYDQLNQTKPKKQMADIMVLDYICGNLDRHAANIFYQTDENGNLTGIVGIDNDMSFPATYKEKTFRNYGLNDTSLDNITSISAETAEHVMRLTPEVLKTALRGVGLSDEELNCTVARLNQVQQRIASDIEYYKDKEPGKLEEGHMRIISDYSQVTLRELSLSSSSKSKLADNPNMEITPGMAVNSPFGRLLNLNKYAIDAEHPSPEKLAQRRELPKGSEIQIHEETEALKPHTYKNDITLLRKGLDLVDPWNVHSSTEFKAMKACLAELDRQLQSLPENPEKAAVTQIRNTYIDLARLSKKYVDKKSQEKDPSEIAIARMEMAENINTAVTMHLNNFDKFVKKQISSVDTSMTELNKVDFFDGIDIDNNEQETYVKTFAELKRSMEPFLTQNDEGRYIIPDGENINELKQLHEAAIQETTKYLNAHENDPDFEQKSELAYKIQRNLMKDYMALQAAKPDVSLYNILSEANGRTVDVTGHIAKTTGNVLSTRRKLTITGPDGNIIKGFFTERDYIGKAGMDIVLNKYSKAYPEYAEDFRYYLANKPESNRNRVLEFSTQMASRHPDDPGYADAFKNFENAVSSQQKKDLQYMMLIDETSSPIDTRNTAMSDIANLLGIGDVIAQSTEMSLRNGKEIIKGTFMYNAEGEDFAHLKEDTAFKNCKEDWMDYSPALRQMSDLTVLDYLCMNVDRHNKNIFYKFDKSDPNNPKLTGIIGIDNDMSFAPISTKYPVCDCGAYHSGLSGITSISQNLAKSVSDLEPSMLKGVLELRGLTREHVEAACQRLDALKTALKEGKIPVYTEKEFLTHKAEDFEINNGQKVTNVFTQVKITVNALNNTIIEPNAPAKPDDVVNLYEKINNLTVKQDAAPLNELGLDLYQATVGVFGGSKEYANVQKSVETLSKVNKQLGSDPNEMTVANLSNLKNNYSAVLKSCMAYLKRKDDQNKYFAPNSKDGRRIQAVRKVVDFCQNRIKCYEPIVQKAMMRNSNKVTDRELQNEQIKQTSAVKSDRSFQGSRL